MLLERQGCIIVTYYIVMDQKAHYGAIVKKAIKESGYTFVFVAEQLDISRTALYDRFKLRRMEHDFLFKVGRLINHDFIEEIPELSISPVYRKLVEAIEIGDIKSRRQKLAKLQISYYNALEDYNKLLKFLVRIVSDNQLPSLKQELTYFIERNFSD